MTSIFVLAVITTILFLLIQAFESHVLRRYGTTVSGT
jgi:hypothetical protein